MNNSNSFIKGALCILFANSLTVNASQVGAPVPDDSVEESILNVDFQTKIQNSEFKFSMPTNYHHEKLKSAPVILSDTKTQELEVRLVVQYANHEFTTFYSGTEVTRALNLRSYNGEVVGPTLIVRPGDTLKIHLINKLPPEQHPPNCDPLGNCNHNSPHNFNTTNLHFHGLHVDPTGSSDNVFIKLQPEDEFHYEVKIPKDHVAGTFWYHAHVHGASSVQVGSGMAGALIIKGDYDELPKLRKAKQRILMLQQIAYDENGRIENNNTYAPVIWDQEAESRGWHISINGQVMPEIELKPGEMQLWRLIHAGVRKNLNLKLVSACNNNKTKRLVQLAADGIPFRKKRVSDDASVFLAPGYRNDVAVKINRRGVYYLVDASNDTDADLPDSYCDEIRGSEPLMLDESAQNILARVVVKGQRLKMRYPSNNSMQTLNRPKSIAEQELSDRIELAEFDIDISVDPWVGLINGQAYDPNQPRYLQLGSAQTWYVSSVFSHHPFHIHVNPFEVIERDENGEIEDRYWKDTIIVNENDVNNGTNNTVELRMRYTDYSGSFVLHCHILDHEDHGMMEKVVISP